MSFVSSSRFAVLEDNAEGRGPRKASQEPKPAPKNSKNPAQTSNAASKSAQVNGTQKARKGKGKAKVVQASQEQWEAWQNRDQQIAKMTSQQSNKGLAKKPKPSKPVEAMHNESTAEKPFEPAVSAELPAMVDSLGIDQFTMLSIQQSVNQIFQADAQTYDNASTNVRILEYRQMLAEKDSQMTKLLQEIKDLQGQLTEAKRRNQVLCELLGNGEMTDKRTLLIQVDALTKDKESLIEQISSLTVALEQERSKKTVLVRGPKKRNDSVNSNIKHN